ncbi:hypothetical protein ACHAQA_005971 [Verticillium albo-atrum]
MSAGTTTTTTSARSRLDPELAAIFAAMGTPPSAKPGPQADALEIRAWSEKFMGLWLAPSPEGVFETKIPVTSYDGATITLHRFTTKEIAEAPQPQPAVVHVHGGGMISGSVSLFAPVVSRYVAETGLPFFSVEYRLAPENPGVGPVTDVYYSLKHLSAHAAEWNIDPARIAVMGESAGGGLAAGAALMARDLALAPPLAKQVLVYPMLDDRTTLPERSPVGDLYVWGAAHNTTAWRAVLGADKAGDPAADVSVYAAPGRAEDLAGLPSTYVEIGGVDLFVGETIAYVGRLAAADVEVEFHLLPGLLHGYDGFNTLSWAKKSLEAKVRALKSF